MADLPPEAAARRSGGPELTSPGLRRWRTTPVKKQTTPKKAARSVKAPRAAKAPKTPPPPVAMRDLVTGYWVSRLVYVAAKLGIADLLAKGPKSAEDLAAAVGVQAGRLLRILRALASV